MGKSDFDGLATTELDVDGNAVPLKPEPRLRRGFSKGLLTIAGAALIDRFAQTRGGGKGEGQEKSRDEEIHPGRVAGGGGGRQGNQSAAGPAFTYVKCGSVVVRWGG